MDFPEITSQPPEAESQALKHAEYIEPASLEDTLLDQLCYLIAHSEGGQCPADCRDCQRLIQVSDLLMIPFEETTPRYGVALSSAT